MRIDLRKLDLMTGAEASEKWGFNRSYVKNMLSKYPDKFIEGSVLMIGNPSKPTLIITREGMEHLTRMNEKEAQSKKQNKSFSKNTLVGLEREIQKKNTLELDSQKGLTEILNSINKD